MLEMKSIEQIIAVMKKFWARHSGGDPVVKAYQCAVDHVSKQYGVAYQTIGDLCRRRLGLKSVNDLYNLLERWTVGDPQALMQTLMENSATEGHHVIRDFFGQEIQDGVKAPSKGSEPFSVRLSAAEARKLRAMLMVKDESLSEWLSKKVSELVNREYRLWVADEADRISGTKGTGGRQ